MSIGSCLPVQRVDCGLQGEDGEVGSRGVDWVLFTGAVRRLRITG